MCGIAGILTRHGAAPDLEVLGRMMDAMRHRGPDDAGNYSDGEVALGFRRLSIIDLAGGHQPLSTACGRYTIVFNGEIYNYRELRVELEREHQLTFRTASDTEVVVNAVKLWGPEALTRLNGMFAFAVWDGRERTLLLARDRIGKKPLYFSASRHGIVFASEIKGLLEHPQVPRTLDETRLPAFLAYRYLPGDETLLAGIHCLPAGTWARISAADSGIEPRTYWDLTVNEADSSPDMPARLEALLDDAVARRMIADVPLGLFLSGGLDSSVILAMMARHATEPVKTFSIGFDTGVSEAAYARQVAERFRADHTEVSFGIGDLLQNLGAALWARETPVTEPSDIPILLLARAARRDVTVVLSGEGSDEIFGGYLKYGIEAAVDRWLPFVPRRLFGLGARLMPYRLRGMQLALECASEPDRLERYAAWFGGFRAEERHRLLYPTATAAEAHGYSRALLARRGIPGVAEQMMYLDLKHWLPANLLLRGDRMTMAAGLELRCPFLDYRLVEFAAHSVACADKAAFNDGKLILKRLARQWLPDYIVDRRKWGFKVPVAQWLRGELLPLLKQRLLAADSPLAHLLDAEAVAVLINEHAAGRKNHEKQLWILLQLELWHAMFVERSLSADDLSLFGEDSLHA